jgi:hypothetical protein
MDDLLDDIVSYDSAATTVAYLGKSTPSPLLFLQHKKIRKNYPESSGLINYDRRETCCQNLITPI